MMSGDLFKKYKQEDNLDHSESLTDEEIASLENICEKLLNSFIDWLKINSPKDLADILDLAYDFKYKILSQDEASLQKLYFKNEKLNLNQKLLLLNHWRVTFNILINSDISRATKDSFKLWFLSLAAQLFPSLRSKGDELWGVFNVSFDLCKYFAISDIPRELSRIKTN